MKKVRADFPSTRLAAGIAIASMLAGGAPPILAQGKVLELEEVVVTARKREETLQRLSQSVSALTKTQIESAFARDVRDLEGMAPNLVIDRIGAGPGVSSISIRGITHQDVEKSFDPAVGVVFDGIFLGTNTGQEFQVFDLERIEVLRGPQGTLFGKNTIGGIINVTTTDPTGEWGGKLRTTYGDYDRLDLEAVVNIPIIQDRLAAKLTGVSRQQDEGFYENVLTNDDVPQIDYQSWGIDLLWTPMESVSVEYNYKREEDDSDTAATTNISQPGDLLCFLYQRCGKSDTQPEIDRRKVDQNFSNEQYIDLDAHTLEVNWDITEALRVTYLFGNRESDEQTDQDFDSTSIDFFSTRRIQDYEQSSHELRLTGEIGDRIDFVAGVYYWESEYQLTQNTYYLAALYGFPPTTVLQSDVDHQTDSTAYFVEADVAITDRLTLTLGGRQTDEDKEMEIHNLADVLGNGLITVPTLDAKPDDDWSEFTPKVSVAWQQTDDLMFYLTYSEGFRSGGLNGRGSTLDAVNTSYDPEFVKMYEAGIKSSWLENRLTLNLAVFTNDYDDKQEEVVIPAPPPTGQQTITVNASTAEMNGIELELRALITEGWTIGFNAGWLDAEYKDFMSDTNLDGVPEDLSDLELRRAPDYTYALNSDYRFPFWCGEASIQAVYRYKDDFYTTFANDQMGFVEGHGLLDASINYSMDHWTFTVFGRNLTDEDEPSAALVVAGLFSFQATRDPRIWGAQITYDW